MPYSNALFLRWGSLGPLPISLMSDAGQTGACRNGRRHRSSNRLIRRPVSAPQKLCQNHKVSARRVADFRQSDLGTARSLLRPCGSVLRVLGAADSAPKLF